jgi:hypothetical protein
MLFLTFNYGSPNYIGYSSISFNQGVSNISPITQQIFERTPLNHPTGLVQHDPCAISSCQVTQSPRRRYSITQKLAEALKIKPIPLCNACGSSWDLWQKEHGITPSVKASLTPSDLMKLIEYEWPRWKFYREAMSKNSLNSLN